MTKPHPTPETSLHDLQRVVRRPPPTDGQPTVMTRRLPRDLTDGKDEYIALFVSEDEVFESTKATLLGDLRFEHLGDAVDDRVWHFLARCHLDRETDHVPNFTADEAREPEDLDCYIPVESLKVEETIEVLGIRLLPVTDPTVPAAEGWFRLDPPVSSVAVIPVRGTSHGRMAESARAVATQVLRLLRVGLREHTAINDQQLRFRLGESYAFTDQLSGWQRRDDAAFEIELTPETVELATSRPIAAVPLNPTTDLERKANLALRWFESAQLATDPIVTLLFLFFALEGILGKRGERLKAAGLAFRRAMLGDVAGFGFVHPNKAFVLYDQVRSAAVHGEDPPDIAPDVLRTFASDVRRAINEALEYASAHGIKRRAALLKALDQHPDKPKLIEWLRANGGDIWNKYLAALATDP